MTVHDHHLTADDMPLFTTLRMTAFEQAVIDITACPSAPTKTRTRGAPHSTSRSRSQPAAVSTCCRPAAR
ncbi:hypothetical protein [Arthrobacter sp. KK5.5]|uniref:hypothetical protein n=1 Tax=Arthrobacter sp. KK5.5 TaxID=3373084 RepID=UPI003EE58D37